jgi:hypothetical protein
MHERLKRCDKTPGEQLYRKPYLRSDALKNNIRGDFCDDNAGRE